MFDDGILPVNQFDPRPMRDMAPLLIRAGYPGAEIIYRVASRANADLESRRRSFWHVMREGGSPWSDPVVPTILLRGLPAGTVPPGCSPIIVVRIFAEAAFHVDQLARGSLTIDLSNLASTSITLDEREVWAIVLERFL